MQVAYTGHSRVRLTTSSKLAIEFMHYNLVKSFEDFQEMHVSEVFFTFDLIVTLTCALNLQNLTSLSSASSVLSSNKVSEMPTIRFFEDTLC